MSRILTRVLIAALCMGAGALTQAAPPATGVIQNEIAAQSLKTALQRWAQQSGIQVMYDAQLARGRKSPGAPAGLANDEALKRILAGTGLTYRMLNQRTVSVVKEGEVAGAAVSAAEQMRLASAGEKAAAADASKDADNQKNQVTVEGRRDREKSEPFSAANIDLRRTEDDVLPFTTFTAEDINTSGASTLEDFFRARLPQNFSSVITAETNGNLSLSSESVDRLDMRGWGNGGETVILVNGRRLPVQRIGADSDYPDNSGAYRGIPLASIERIEVLSSAGGAIYGENATAGIINIITRRDWNGGLLALGYENVTDGHGPRKSVDIRYGFPLRAGLSAKLGGSFSDSDPVLLGERAETTSVRWRQRIMARDPQRITDTFAPLLGATPNVRSQDGMPLFGAGTPAFTSVPAGYAGGGGLTPFLDRQGVYNLELSNGTGIGFATDTQSGRRSPLGTGLRVSTFNAGLEQQIGPRWRATLDYNRREDRITGVSFVPFFFANLSAASPYNPFGRTVVVAFDDPRFERSDLKQQLGSTVDQVTASLAGSLGSWRMLFDFNTSHERSRMVYDRFGRPVHDGVAITMTQAITLGLYNPLVDMRTVAPAAPGFYENAAIETTRVIGGTRSHQADLKTSGTLFAVPGGDAALTAGLEWLREDRYRGFQSTRYLNPDTGADMRPVDSLGGDENTFLFDTYAAYAEMTVPVFGGERTLPFVERLEVFASGRMSRQVRNGYSLDFDEDFNSFTVPVRYETHPHLYAAGARYDMMKGVALRVSRSLGFKPPTLSNVTPYPAAYRYEQTVTDRVLNRSTIVSPAQYAAGGNPAAEPESTQSTNIGLILQPSWSRGLRLSVDYVESTRDNALTPLNPQVVLDMEIIDPAVAARVQRDAGGQITFIDARVINFNLIESRSLDLMLNQSFGNVMGGVLSFSAAATRNISFKVQTSSSSPALEQVRNRTAFFSQQLEWNGNAQLRWEGRQWSFGWSTRYFDSVLARPEDIAVQGSDRAPHQFEHDAYGSFRFDGAGFGGLFDGTALTFGIRNVFDREPRFWAANPGLGYLSFDSIYGRSVWLQARRSF